MEKNFADFDFEKYIPFPICEEYPQYAELYKKAWELAFAHVRYIDGMPQNPYMDEAFCDTQVWIWDSCFMSLFCKYAKEIFPGIETLNNFYKVLYEGARLPQIIPSEKEPKWTGAVPGKSTDIMIHIADNPPLFAWVEYENALLSGDAEHIKELLYERQILQKHYEWFESLKESVIPEGVSSPTCLISEDCGYKWEGGRSGMDNTPRGKITEKALKERPNNPDMLWVDAICQQALSAKMIAKLFKLVGDSENAKEWNKKFLGKKEIINRYYWDSEDRFYYDINSLTKEYYKVMTVASFWSLTSGVASREQAVAMAEHILNPNTFGGKVPLVSLSRSDADFCHEGKYWRGSLWLPTAYAALKGLAEYGFYDIAHEVGHKIFKHIFDTYLLFEPHTIWECYSPDYPMPGTTAEDTGEMARPDFCGWSALGPISIYIEYVLGFHTINSFENFIEWQKPDDFKGEIGIKNLRFGKVITDIIADGNSCTVTSNSPYTLKINGREFAITSGETHIVLE